jgi:hypothetical protein
MQMEKNGENIVDIIHLRLDISIIQVMKVELKIKVIQVLMPRHIGYVHMNIIIL